MVQQCLQYRRYVRPCGQWKEWKKLAEIVGHGDGLGELPRGWDLDVTIWNSPGNRGYDGYGFVFKLDMPEFVATLSVKV